MRGALRAVALGSLIVLSIVATGFAAGSGVATTGADSTVSALDQDIVAQTGSYARGEPELVAYLAEPAVQPGGTSTVNVGLLNEGGYDLGGSSPQPRVTTARAVAVSAEAEHDAFSVESGTVPVGSVTTDTPSTVPIDLTVSDDVEPGEYDLDLEVTYTYTEWIDPDGNNVQEETTTEDLTVTVVVEDGPRFEIVEADTDAGIAGSGNVTATVSNTGNEIARDATVRASAADSRVVIGDDGTGTDYVGDWEPGQNRTVTFDSTVSEEFVGGGYILESSVEYTDASGAQETSATSRAGVFPLDEQSFAIRDVETDAQVGGSGDVNVILENIGNQTVREASITASAAGSQVVLGGDGSGTAYVGEWEPGERRTVTFDSAISGDFVADGYAMETSVEYIDASGVEATSPTERAGVFPIDEQAFTIRDVEDSLEVGYEGEITATVRNDGPEQATDAVVAVEPISDRVSIDERRYALPDLEPGESAEVAYTADVSGQADPGPRQIRFTIEYDAGDGVTSTTESDRVTIDPRTPEFDVVAANASVPAGETRQIEFTVTNQRPETLSSIRANLYADSPITVVDEEAYVDELEPGESTKIQLEIRAAGDANAKTYPLELDFRYEDEGRNDRISDVYDYPLVVTEPVESEGPSMGLLAGGVLVVALVIAGGIWYRRR